jgi:hypothetical protein
MYVNVLRPAQTSLIPDYEHTRSTSIAREQRDKQQNSEHILLVNLLLRNTAAVR